MSEIVRVSWESGPHTHTNERYAAEFYRLPGSGPSDDAKTLEYAEGFATWLKAAHCNGGRSLSRVVVICLDDGVEEAPEIGTIRYRGSA